MGQRAGVATLLVRTGYGAQVERVGTPTPDYVVSGLWEAAQVIQNILTDKYRRREGGH